MKRIDVLELIIQECESVVNMPVHTMRGAPDRLVPCVLIDDEKHPRFPLAVNPSDGVAKDDAGNAIGERLLFGYKGTPDIVVRHGHQTESMRILQQLKDHFCKIERRPRSLHDQFRQFDVGDEYARDVDYAIADDVYQQVLPLDLLYLDVVVADADTIEEFYNTIENDEGGTINNTVN